MLYLFSFSFDICVVTNSTINHPPVNAYSAQVHAALARSYNEAIAASDVKAIVITGTGSFFVAGADISGIASTKKGPEGLAGFKKFATEANQLFNTIESGKKPVVAAVNGTAFGGGLELAMTCNARIGTPKSQWGLPELKIGLIPAFGGCQRLPRLIGVQAAVPAILTSKTFKAADALKAGIADAIVPDSMDHITLIVIHHVCA